MLMPTGIPICSVILPITPTHLHWCLHMFSHITHHTYTPTLVSPYVQSYYPSHLHTYTGVPICSAVLPITPTHLHWCPHMFNHITHHTYTPTLVSPYVQSYFPSHLHTYTGVPIFSVILPITPTHLHWCPHMFSHITHHTYTPTLVSPYVHITHHTYTPTLVSPYVQSYYPSHLHTYTGVTKFQ